MSDPTLALVPRSQLSITQRAREQFTDQQVELIRATVAKDCTLAELHMFLELSARYELDPFAKEIWAIKLKATEPVVIIVARDGLLQVAQRTGQFEGIIGDVVHENDDFGKSAASELPDHSYGAKDRGEIVGAWAIAYRKGRKPAYFFAPFSEYCPDKSSPKYRYSPWSSQASAMILKCAEAMVLRKTFSISGVVGAEEMDRSIASQPTMVNGAKADSAAPESDEIEWGDAPDVRVWLQWLVGEVNTANPGSLLPAKLRVKLAGATDDERIEFALTLVDRLRERGGDIPPRPTVEEAEKFLAGPQEPTEEVQDAELVHDADEPPADFVPGGPQDEGEPLFGSDAA